MPELFLNKKTHLYKTFPIDFISLPEVLRCLIAFGNRAELFVLHGNARPIRNEKHDGVIFSLLSLYEFVF